MNIARQYPVLGIDRIAPSEDRDDVISLIQVRDFLVRQWRLITVITILMIVGGIAFVATSQKQYTAQADMIIDTKRITWTQSELASENRTVEDASVESEIETTKSEKVALAVINRLNLIADPEFVGSGEPPWWRRLIAKIRSSNEPVSAPTKVEIQNQAIATFKAKLRVTRLGRSYIEQIAFTSLDREKAAKIANSVAEAYIDDQLQAKFEATRRASAWLEQRIGELRQQASNAFKEVQDFKSQNSIIIGVDGKLASEVELDQLGAALAKARADTTQASAKFDRISRVMEQRFAKGQLNIPDPIVTDALSNPIITKLRQQFLDDQGKESEWSGRYGPEHQAAKNLRLEMAAIQRAIWDEISRIAESYKSEFQIARSQEEAIDKRMLEVFQKSSSTRQSQVRLRELETAANTYRGIYETFLNRFTQSVQQQSFPSTEARLVTVASPPQVPSSPKLALTLALAGICGLGLGVIAAFGRERLNRKIRTRDEIENLLGKSCLAVFPAYRKLRPLDSNARRQGMATQGSTAFRLIHDAAPFSATAEALRYIKVAVDLHPAGAKNLGVVSALSGEGKTTVSISLAAFLAKSGARVLLIDADLRNPSLSRALGYADGPGLLDMVAEKTNFKNFVSTDAKYGFDVLPASTRMRAPNSSDVLTSARMKDMLRTAFAEYDYIISDLPPILPVVDVKAAAHMFDAFIMVVEWNFTSTDEILKAVKTSPILSERLIGTILNRVNENTMRRYEGYSARHYNYYSS